MTLNGERSKLYCDVPLQEIRIKPKGAIVRKIVIWWIKNNQNLYAVQFLDRDDQCILKAGYFHNSYLRKEIPLAEDERILGIISRQNNPVNAQHLDLQFKIGRIIA